MPFDDAIRNFSNSKTSDDKISADDYHHSFWSGYYKTAPASFFSSHKRSRPGFLKKLDNAYSVNNF